MAAIDDKIDQLLERNRWTEAIAALSDMNGAPGDAKIVTRLRDMRIKAFEHIAKLAAGGAEKAPLFRCADPFPDVKNDIPEIKAGQLNIRKFAGAMTHHGALIVRGLLPKPVIPDLIGGIENTMQGAAEFVKNGEAAVKNNPWFVPTNNVDNKQFNKDSLFMMQQTGSMWTLFSPEMTRELIAIFGVLNLKSLLTEYFGSEPCLSFNKWVLRKAKPLDNPADWHQDGAFMGPGIKSVNLWMALSECGAGTNRPGMDIVPRRLKRVMGTGKNGANFDWSVSEKSVMEWFKDTPPVRPHFDAGDAIFFDHFNLHSTSYSKEFTDIRYAIETWFFALDSYADNQSPVVW